MLLKLGVDVNAVGSKGNRAMEIACRKGDLAVVKALIAHGADLRLKTNSGTTVLHEAALGGSGEVIAALIGAGAPVDAADGESASTALHYAASFGRVEAVRALVRGGADVTRKNAKGLTALETAIRNGQDEAAAALSALKRDK